MSTLLRAIFGVGLVVGLANTAGILASTAGTSEYYPLGERDWRFYVFWGCSHVLNLALVAVGVLQWQELGLHWLSIPVGGTLFLAGVAVAIAGALDLGIDETQGMRGELRTGGLYRYSRNPQYVGYIAATVGFPLVTGAPLAIPLAAIYLVWWLVFPLAEEPWLHAEYGDEYEHYVASVPRFVGWRTITALRGPRNDADSAEQQ